MSEPSDAPSVPRDNVVRLGGRQAALGMPGSGRATNGRAPIAIAVIALLVPAAFCLGVLWRGHSAPPAVVGDAPDAPRARGEAFRQWLSVFEEPKYSRFAFPAVTVADEPMWSFVDHAVLRGEHRETYWTAGAARISGSGVTTTISTAVAGSTYTVYAASCPQIIWGAR